MKCCKCGEKYNLFPLEDGGEEMICEQCIVEEQKGYCHYCGKKINPKDGFLYCSWECSEADDC